MQCEEDFGEVGLLLIVAFDYLGKLVMYLFGFGLCRLIVENAEDYFFEKISKIWQALNASAQEALYKDRL